MGPKKVFEMLTRAWVEWNFRWMKFLSHIKKNKHGEQSNRIDAPKQMLHRSIPLSNVVHKVVKERALLAVGWVIYRLVHLHWVPKKSNRLHRNGIEPRIECMSIEHSWMVVVFRVHRVETHVTTSDNNEALKLFHRAALQMTIVRPRDSQYVRMLCTETFNARLKRIMFIRIHSTGNHIAKVFIYRSISGVEVSKSHRISAWAESVSEIRLFTFFGMAKRNKSVNKTQSKTCSTLEFGPFVNCAEPKVVFVVVFFFASLRHTFNWQKPNKNLA